MRRFLAILDTRNEWRVLDTLLGLYMDARGPNGSRRYWTRADAEAIAAEWNAVWEYRAVLV